MAQPAMDGVDMSKVQFRSYAFHFLLAAGKGCLFPFLTIYMRMLGLTAVQVGVIVGVGAWVTMISSTCLTHCATRCNKRRFMLVTSLVALILSYMLLTVVPPINDDVALGFCNKTRVVPNDGASMNSESSTLAALMNTTTSLPTQGPLSSPNTETSSTMLTTITPVIRTTLLTDEEEQEEKTPPKQPPAVTEESPVVEEDQPVEEEQQPVEEEQPPVEEKQPPVEEEQPPVEEEQPPVEEEQLPVEEESNVDLSQVFSDEDMQILEDAGVDLDAIKGMSEEEIIDYLEKLTNGMEDNESDKTEKPKHHGHRTRGRRDTAKSQNDTAGSSDLDETEEEYSLIESLLSKLSSLQNQIKQLRKQVFAAVLVLIITASWLGSPVDKLADDTWFEFLDSTDMLEKYGQHRSWAALGLIMIPVTISIIVEHTSCLLPGDILNIKIHFFAFLILMFFCFILAFLYPIFQERKKVQRLTKLSRGFRILFGDCHASLFSLTVFILGLLQAVPTVFLFWLVQDLNGSELIMGLSISAAAFSQLVMHILHRWLIRRLTHAAAVVLGLLVLAAKLILYSLTSSPWLVLVGEGLTGFSTGLVLAAVMSYPDFRLNPFVMDRSALSAMNIVHTGFGVAAGSIIAGILYDHVGLPHVLQGGCVLAVTWALIFAVLCRCVPKKTKVRYAKLLQEDETTSEDESFDENDWLEIALKHQK